jgi:hypothetical protein
MKILPRFREARLVAGCLLILGTRKGEAGMVLLTRLRL